MKWEQLISNKRLGLEELHLKKKDDRTEFQRDYDRLIFSAPFRRLQNKTQVFPLPGNIFVHNRLTHSLEVSSVGRSLGNDCARLLLEKHPELQHTHVTELGAIVSAACLAHDLGNPPFGHSGEEAIGTFFSEGQGQWLKDYHDELDPAGLTEAQWNDLTHFEGNANTFRLLTHHFNGRRPGGFVMTYTTLASVVKYPYSSSLAGNHRKFGFFESEQKDFLKIAHELGMHPKENSEKGVSFTRHPLVYLVEAADDICYQIMDIEDAHKLKILSTEETQRLLLDFFPTERQKSILEMMEKVTDINEQIVYLRSCAIGCLVQECVRTFIEHEDEILEGTFHGTLIQQISSLPRQAYRQCSSTAFKKIYRSKDVVDVELAGFKVITSLLELYLEAVTHPHKAHSRLLINLVSSQYETTATTLYDRVMAVLDFISGMTDIYALDLYRKIHGINLPHV